jgi:hypothetical protein
MGLAALSAEVRPRELAVPGHSEEPAMGRRLRYQDSYGRWHRDRAANRGSSGGSAIPAKWVVIGLIVLAAFVVLAFLGH